MSSGLGLLAIDIGAESGRAVLGILDSRRLTLQELHRFPNRPVRVGNTLYWDALRLYDEILTSIRTAFQQSPVPLQTVGVDTWGVDFALLDKQGRLIANPVHYRDRRTEGMMERAFQQVPPETLYERTGIQFMPINTLYQLYSLVQSADPQLEWAEHLLMMPDLFHYWLTGERVNEFTIATTSQCYDPRRQQWAREILGALGIPSRLFSEIRTPGTVLGSVRIEGLEPPSPIQVVLPGSHDTASAVAGTPLSDPKAVYISSGTWSLVGVEVAEPIISEASMVHNFTNEGGVGGTFRFLRNVMGLWLLQESRRTWEQEGTSYSYEQLVALAEAEPPFRSILDPDDWRFLPPGNMPARIRAFCQETQQPLPETPGAVVRCVIESLALKYRWVIERIESIGGFKVPVVHIVGGGTNNRMLCQATADATARPVIAGPVEATAVGNLLVQAMGMGLLGGLYEIREVVRHSFELRTYEPQNPDAWGEPYERFLNLIARD